MGKVQQPTIVSEMGDIPVIDLSNPDKAALVAEIGDACDKWGLFQVVNHGVPLETHKNPERLARKFFALPREEKIKVIRDETNPSGFFDAELTGNVKDSKEIFEFYVNEPTVTRVWPDDPEPKSIFSRWPEQPPEFKTLMREFALEVEKMTFRLLELVAESLGMAPHYFHRFFKDHTAACRILHYSPSPSDDIQYGLGPHKDSGCLTIIVQDDVGGLQAKRRTDGRYVGVKPTPDAFVVFVSDLIQVWTNDKYQSVEHHVVTLKERYSTVFPFYPSHYVTVKPLEEFVDEHNPPKYKEYNWGRFHASRKMTNLKMTNTEKLQIDHFKISTIGITESGIKEEA